MASHLSIHSDTGWDTVHHAALIPKAETIEKSHSSVVDFVEYVDRGSYFFVWVFFLFFICFIVLFSHGAEHKIQGLCTLGKCSNTELPTQPRSSFLLIFPY
jgi:hypothetical protein